MDLWLLSPFFEFTSFDCLFELVLVDDEPAVTFVFGVDFIDTKLTVFFDGEMLPFELSVEWCVDGEEVDDNVTSDDTLLAEWMRSV